MCKVHSRSTEQLPRPFSSAENRFVNVNFSSNDCKCFVTFGLDFRRPNFLSSPPPPPLGCGFTYYQHSSLCPEVARALNGVMLIAEQKKRLEESTKVTLNYNLKFLFIKLANNIRQRSQ